MTSKTLTLTRVEYDQMTDGVNALRDELTKQYDEVKRLTGIAWEHGNRADAAEEEAKRLRAELQQSQETLTACLETSDAAEIEGLRAALQKIAGLGAWGVGAIAIAQRALAD